MRNETARTLPIPTRFSLSLTLFALIGMSLTLCSQAETSQPKNVVDFYMRLPARYFEHSMNSKERLDWAKLTSSVIDTKNGFMFIGGDGAQQSITVCLFKRSDNSYVIAVGDNNHDVFDPYLDFYRYQNGKWRNVTRQLLPVRWNSNWDYVLPRYGRTIHVHKKSHRKAYDLEWKDDRFHVVKSKEHTG